ncbi:glycoside hydrolase superfamily [Pterulicium gracile]|uniref:Glycoside hydrolase superfamily n=1 Tax=Pterulicium gracile TaxID=1884261 RepID=A0A5C3QIF3_9AGAR|nr:glycoside hydrolase superfamily [Pterula gracilis]
MRMPMRICSTPARRRGRTSLRQPEGSLPPQEGESSSEGPLSIGGDMNKPDIETVIRDDRKRARFVKTAVTILEDYGFDGIDMHYEIYPSVDNESHHLRLIRALLNELNVIYAVGSVHRNGGLANLRADRMDKSRKHAYRDLRLAGSRNPGEPDHSSPRSRLRSWQNESQSVENVVNRWLEDYHIDREKLVIGIPLFGVLFDQVNGYKGIGGLRVLVAGAPALPLPGFEVHHNEYKGSCWSQHKDHQQMTSFDDETVARQKGEWIAKEGLGGAMFWDLSSDKGNEEGRDQIESNHDHYPGPGRMRVDGPSLVTTVTNVIGDREYSENCSITRAWDKGGGDQYGDDDE